MDVILRALLLLSSRGSLVCFRLEHRREALRGISRVLVLRLDVSVCLRAVQTFATRDKDILLDGSGEHAKEHVVNMFSDEVHATRGTRDVRGFAAEPFRVFFHEIIEACPKGR